MKRVVIDEKRCVKCGACAQRCPFGALKKESGKLLHAPGKCVRECEVCWLVCPEGAVSYEEFSCGGCGTGASGDCRKGEACAGEHSARACGGCKNGAACQQSGACAGSQGRKKGPR